MRTTPTPQPDTIYEDLWQRARTAFATGAVEIDPQLLDRTHDHRRGMTLVIRPTPNVQQALDPLFAELAAATPEQHLYHRAELHVTVLSLFTATPEWAPHFARIDEYIAAVDAAVAQAQPFSIDFRGVTASAGAVMIQGFPQPGLDTLREALRTALRAAGFGDGLDRRYRLVTAHMTLLRFQRPPVAIHRLLEVLARYRTHTFGTDHVTHVDLVDNNWYMSRDQVQLLKHYGL